jgi:predicted metal-binding protein
MPDREALEAVFRKHGCTEFTWIDPKKIVVAQWVRMKCRFGCDEYGRTATCPPNVPSVEECRTFFNDYTEAAVFHFAKRVDKPEDRHVWTRSISRKLLDVEREVFIAGHRKAFVLFMDSCTLCPECAGTKADCRNPEGARPTPEAMAVDVFATVRPYGLPIEVLADYSGTMNRYAFLLVE